jgi:hypothetical protein
MDRPTDIDALNCATLENNDEYSRYFNHLCTVFSRLLSCYKTTDVENLYEVHAVHIYLTKFLYTIEALRKKYTHNPAHTLRVDLTESGFPNFLEISYLSIDLLNRQDRLNALPPASMLKQGMLDHMFKYREEPKALLWQMSEREYYEMLDEKNLFLPFTPGRLELRGEANGFRNYLFSWGCYDFRSNRPYLHLLTFDQTATADPLQWKGANYNQFLEVVKAEGSRVPDVGILALAIDSDLEDIHPKVLKRICIGPLHSSMACAGDDDLCNLITTYGKAQEEFILLLKDEIVFSQRQQVVSRGESSPQRVREVFYIPEADLDCYEHRASRIHRYMLLPHHVLQSMMADEQRSQYPQHRKLSFDEEGNVHGV